MASGLGSHRFISSTRQKQQYRAKTSLYGSTSASAQLNRRQRLQKKYNNVLTRLRKYEETIPLIKLLTSERRRGSYFKMIKARKDVEHDLGLSQQQQQQKNKNLMNSQPATSSTSQDEFLLDDDTDNNVSTAHLDPFGLFSSEEEEK